MTRTIRMNDLRTRIIRMNDLTALGSTAWSHFSARFEQLYRMIDPSHHTG
jgi:hypothetical protein